MTNGEEESIHNINRTPELTDFQQDFTRRKDLALRNPNVVALEQAKQNYEEHIQEAEKDPNVLGGLGDYIDLFIANVELDTDTSFDGKQRSRTQREFRVELVQERINGKINKQILGYQQGVENSERVITELLDAHKKLIPTDTATDTAFHEKKLAEGLMRRKTGIMRTKSQQSPPILSLDR